MGQLWTKTSFGFIKFILFFLEIVFGIIVLYRKNRVLTGDFDHKLTVSISFLPIFKFAESRNVKIYLIKHYQFNSKVTKITNENTNLLNEMSLTVDKGNHSDFKK